MEPTAVESGYGTQTCSHSRKLPPYIGKKWIKSDRNNLGNVRSFHGAFRIPSIKMPRSQANMIQTSAHKLSIPAAVAQHAVTGSGIILGVKDTVRLVAAIAECLARGIGSRMFPRLESRRISRCSAIFARSAPVDLAFVGIGMGVSP